MCTINIHVFTIVYLILQVWILTQSLCIKILCTCSSLNRVSISRCLGNWFDQIASCLPLGGACLPTGLGWVGGGPSIRSVTFLGIEWSVFRRMVKLAVPHYAYLRHYHPKRERVMGMKSESLLCPWFQTLGVGQALVGVACTMALVFGTRKEANCHLKQLGKYFCSPIVKLILFKN